MRRNSLATRSAPAMSALLTTKMSAISRMPALMICTESPLAGVVTTTVVSAVCITSSSDWPTPTVSSRQRSRPLASMSRIASRAALAAAGRAGDADHVGATGAAAPLAEKVLDRGVAVLDHADGPGQGAHLAAEQALCEIHHGRVYPAARRRHSSN